jgi:type IV secretion system protein VirB4
MDLVRRRSAIHSTLKMFTAGGEYDGLFDAATDALTVHPVQTFEMRHLLHRPSILGPVLRYVFLHVEQQMSTAAPMLLAMDDAAVAWMADAMTQDTTGMAGVKREEKIQTYLQTTAKKAVSVGFSTHSLVKVFGGPLGTLLQEACPTRFCLPNGAALEPDIYAIYQRLGYTDQAIQQIARARPQRDCYFSQRELGQQLISVPLPQTVLDCVARNSAADHALMDKLLTEEGADGFAPAWMRAVGQEAGAQFVERYHNDTQRMVGTARVEADSDPEGQCGGELARL